MSNVTRNYKDNVFCIMYREKKHLLSLYNAMNGTSYEDEDALEVVTLDGAICMKMKNDVAFVIDSRLNLYEQQSTDNPNMPLRDLYYVAEELKKIAPPGKLYASKEVKIPAPKFVVFYNGAAKRNEDRTVCRLSDLFEKQEGEPELELKVTVVNINPGHNDELLRGCESLRGYMAFVEKVRGKTAGRVPLEAAVSEAVDECISEGILADFFREKREEIVEMGIFEFDQELYDQALWEGGEAAGYEKGEADGLKKASRIYQQIQVGNKDNQLIAEACGCSVETVEEIRAAVSEAVDECISEGILADFFREKREEIVETGIFGFDQKLYDQALWEGGEAAGYEKGEAAGYEKGEAAGYEKGEADGYTKGEADGMKKGARIYRQIQAGNMDNQSIAEACGCSVETVEEIRAAFGI